MSLSDSSPQTILGPPKPCRWCSAGSSLTYHTGPCPRVKAIEFHPDGMIKRVEFKDE